MPGPNRRSRRLKQTTSLDSVEEFSVTNPQDGDLLVYNSTDGLFENTTNLPASYIIGGAVTADSLTLISGATVGGTLSVTGATDLSSSLEVDGNTTLNNPVTMGSTLSVTGSTTLSSTLDVTGLLTGSSGFFVTGNSTITGDLTVTGNISGSFLLDGADLALGDLSATGNVSFDSTLSVAGYSALNGGFSAPSGSVGTLTATDLTIDASLCISDVFCLNYDVVGGATSGDLVMEDEATPIYIYGTETGAVFGAYGQRPMAIFDPDASVTLHHSGEVTAFTSAAGMKIAGKSGN